MKKTPAVFAVVLALLFAASACSTPTAKTMTIGTVETSVKGNVVTIPVNIEGIQIVKANGDTSQKTGHFHVFIDRPPVAVGQTIPKEKGIVHTADNPIKLYGLSVGHHTFTVVVGDGTHKRFGADLLVTASVNVEGPTLQATAPATVKEGENVPVSITAAPAGIDIRKADGDTSGKSGHYHVLIDPATPPKAGDVIPPAVPGKIIHTIDTQISVPALALGDHTIYVVLGDGTHKAFDPPVMAKLAVTVVPK